MFFCLSKWLVMIQYDSLSLKKYFAIDFFIQPQRYWLPDSDNLQYFFPVVFGDWKFYLIWCICIRPIRKKLLLVYRHLRQKNIDYRAVYCPVVNIFSLCRFSFKNYHLQMLKVNIHKKHISFENDWLSTKKYWLPGSGILHYPVVNIFGTKSFKSKTNPNS